MTSISSSFSFQLSMPPIPYLVCPSSSSSSLCNLLSASHLPVLLSPWQNQPAFINSFPWSCRKWEYCSLILTFRDSNSTGSAKETEEWMSHCSLSHQSPYCQRGFVKLWSVCMKKCGYVHKVIVQSSSWWQGMNGPNTMIRSSYSRKCSCSQHLFRDKLKLLLQSEYYFYRWWWN